MRLAVFLAPALLLPAAAPAQNADFIWRGGTIWAEGGAHPEALAVKDGRIVAMGTRAEVERKWAGRLTLPIDLYGQSLVAGTVVTPTPTPAPPKAARRVEKAAEASPTPAPRRTPHPAPPKRTPLPIPPGPAPSLEELSADLGPPPDGLPYTITTLRDALRAWVLRSSLPRRHRIVLGFGFDESRLEEKRPPTREELDTVSATIPVIAVSKSGTLATYSTLALQRAGISWRSKDPAGGVIRRRGRIQEPNGVLEGTAHQAAFQKLVPRLDEKERSHLLAEALVLNAPETGRETEIAAVATPAPTPAPAPAPTPAPALAAAPPAPAVPPRDAGSAALAALVADVLAGRAALAVGRAADMSVLARDPSREEGNASLGEAPKRLEVVEEVRRGRTVWRRDSARR